MFLLSLSKNVNFRSGFSRTKRVLIARMSSEPKKEVETSKAAPTHDTSAHDMMRARHYIPTDFERKMLVWVGRYKTTEDIPKAISVEIYEKARNRVRIKIANYMMLATAIACVMFAVSGKRAAERGESVAKMNLDWHKTINQGKEK